MLHDAYNPETDPQEAARSAGLMLRTGTVAQVDLPRGLVRFQTGGLLTQWLPWFAHRAGGGSGGRMWCPPVVGEQGMLLAPGGDLLRGVVLMGIYSTAMPAGTQDAGTLQVQMPQCIDLSVGSARLVITPQSIDMSAGGATLSVGGGVVTASSDVIAGGISLTKHVHGGVTRGGARTDRPQ